MYICLISLPYFCLYSNVTTRPILSTLFQIATLIPGTPYCTSVIFTIAFTPEISSSQLVMCIYVCICVGGGGYGYICMYFFLSSLYYMHKLLQQCLEQRRHPNICYFNYTQLYYVPMINIKESTSVLSTFWQYVRVIKEFQ